MTKLELISELTGFQRLRQRGCTDPLEFERAKLRVLDLVPTLRELVIEHVPEDAVQAATGRTPS